MKLQIQFFKMKNTRLPTPIKSSLGALVCVPQGMVRHTVCPIPIVLHAPFAQFRHNFEERIANLLAGLSVYFLL